MEIISIPFALLALGSGIIYYILSPKHRILYLALLSGGFIAGYNYYLLLYIIIFCIINYFIGVKIHESQQKKLLLTTGVIFNILQLVVLKYASFAIDPVMTMFHLDIQVSKIAEIIVPLGISYFTLQAIGYLINVKMGWEKPESSFPDFLLYFIFYPKFLSGPVERSNHFLPQAKIGKSFNVQQVTDGLRIALFGFFKKVVIANQIGVLITDAYAGSSPDGSVNLLVVLLVQPLYLYFDFSGYTDIAIGLAKTYGYDLLPNFNRPFLSINVTTFWKRFHMSLSFWFNDYVFKQMSFRYRRLGKYAAMITVFVTFTLFGIWHGAGWNFMILGFIQALAINFEFFTKKTRTRLFSQLPDSVRKATGRIITYVFFGLSLVFFFSPDLEYAFQFYSRVFENAPGVTLISYGIVFFPSLIIAIILLIFEYIQEDLAKTFSVIENYWRSSLTLRIFSYYFMSILIMALIGTRLTFVYQAF